MINFDKNQDVLVIFGATASGKSDFAISLAKEIDGVIINADSSQIYKETPILSNITPLDQRRGIPHKLFSYLSLNEDSSVINWLSLVNEEILLAKNNNKVPIVVGGSGMYISSLLYGISNIPSNPENKQKSIALFHQLGHDKFLRMMQKLDEKYIQKFQDSQRLIRAYEVYLCSSKTMTYFQSLPKKKYVNYNFINLFIYEDRQVLYEKINQRTKNMLAQGAIEEIKTILNTNQNEQILKKILGACEINLYLKNEITLENCLSKIQQKTRNYAKRQITWFTHQIHEKIIIEKNAKNNYKNCINLLY